MTKRELIDALENLDCTDNTVVMVWNVEFSEIKEVEKDVVNGLIILNPKS